GCGFLVEGLEHAPLPGTRPHMLQHQLVDLCAHPPDDPAIALGQPQRGLGVAEPGILLRVDQAEDLVLERRDPVGIVFISLPGEIDESASVRPRLHGPDTDISTHDRLVAGQGWTRNRIFRAMPAPRWCHYLLRLAARIMNKSIALERGGAS